MDDPPADANQSPPQTSSLDEPVAPVETPAGDEQTGNEFPPETPTSEETPPEGGESTEAGENVLSHSNESPELSEKEQALAKEVAQLLAEGGIQIGELKRIKDRLVRAGLPNPEREVLEQKLQELQQQVEELRQGEATPANDVLAENPLQNRVKSEADVRRMKRDLHEIVEFCEDNPDGGRFRGQDYSPEQVREMRRDARKAIDIWLPERADQLVREQQVSHAQVQYRQLVQKLAPEAYDPENPVGQTVAHLLRTDNYLKSLPNRDYAAAALALGVAELQRREKAKAAPARNGAAAPRPGTTPGRTPTGKPSSVVTSPNATVRTGDNRLSRAMDRVKKERSRDALAEFHEALEAASSKRK